MISEMKLIEIPQFGSVNGVNRQSGKGSALPSDDSKCVYVYVRVRVC